MPARHPAREIRYHDPRKADRLTGIDEGAYPLDAGCPAASRIRLAIASG